MKILFMFFYIFGVISSSIFVHEGIHWLQYNYIQDKQICFFDSYALQQGKLAYLDMKNDVVFLSSKEFNLREIEAWLGTIVIVLIGILPFIKE